MDYKTYKAARESLLERLFAARRTLCPRTVHARARDIARLDSGYHGKSYEECLEEVYEYYNIEKK